MSAHDTRPPLVNRRTALRLGVVSVWSVGMFALGQAPAVAAAPIVPKRAAADAEEVTEPRYRFDAVTPVPGFAPLGRMEEVWASPGYMTITDCVVSYIGTEPFRLTAEESAIVDVAEAAGAVVSDREGLYLVILAASTRIDPARFEVKLAELGRPVAAASLALAPAAPQAGRMAAWLQATA
jgi:hypothetical protein